MKPIRVAEGVYRRGSSLSIAYWARLPDGKRKQVWESGFCSVKEAKEARALRMAEAKRGVVVTRRKMPVAALLDEWWEVASLHWSESTRGTNGWLVSLVKGALGGTPIGELGPADLSHLWGELAQYSTSVKRGAMSCLRQAVKYAMARGYIGRDPWIGWRTPKQPREARPFLPLETIEAILNEVASTTIQRMFRLIAGTGLRRSEAAGLTWDAVDLDEGVLEVRRVWIQVPGRKGAWKDTPKTEAGRRRVPLTADLVDMLRQHRREVLERRLRKGAQWRGSNLVFPSNKGGAYSPSHLSNIFRDAANRAGYPGARLHDLRHAYGSRLLAAGASIKDVQLVLGHSDVQTTLGRYCHALPGHIDRIRNLLEVGGHASQR